MKDLLLETSNFGEIGYRNFGIEDNSTWAIMYWRAINCGIGPSTLRRGSFINGLETE
jgi:hypothetical protein